MNNPVIKKITNDMAKELYGVDPVESKAKGLCINCKEPALPKCYSDAGIKEFDISGLCEKCFDALFE